tara:strand:+ start:1469 stop:2971 length:1503 start_codon:yes stop_codon:yes gene_type:complete
LIFKRILVSLFIFFAFVFPKDYLSGNIILFIDPFDMSNFILDIYNPNSNTDIQYYSIMLDGSCNFPLYQSIPKPVYIDRYKSGTVSQLSYLERKQDKYFDTSISLKKDVNLSTNMLLQVESKSIKTNISQNAFLNYKKNTDKLKLDVSYLYHYEDDPDTYNLLISNNASKEFESFNLGVDAEYIMKNLLFKSHFAIQTSHVNRFVYNLDEYEYDSQSVWSNIYFDYSLNSKIKLHLGNEYKKNITEDSELLTILSNDNYSLIGIGVEYLANKSIELRVGSNIYSDIYKPFIDFKYKLDKIKLIFNIDNYIDDNIKSNDFGIEKYEMDLTSNRSIGIDLNYNIISNSIKYGYISNSTLEYDYVILNGLYDFNKIMFSYNYSKYFNNIKGSLNMNSYLHYSISYFPFKDKYTFEIYCKLHYYQYELNSMVNLLSLDIFDGGTINNVKLYNFDVGIMFEALTFSYKFKNGITEQLLNNTIKYSPDMNKFGRFNYIEISWIFKD